MLIGNNHVPSNDEGGNKQLEGDGLKMGVKP